MPRHVTERSLSANALNKRSAGKSITPRVVPEPAERMVVGIDGAFIKAGHTGAGQRHQFEILTGRVEASQRGGEAFAVVRDLDPYAKRRVHPFSGAAVEDKTRI